MSCLLRLPRELQVLIVSHLDASSMLHLASSSTHMAALVSSPIEWHNLLEMIHLDRRGVTLLANFMKSVQDPALLLLAVLRTICRRYNPIDDGKTKMTSISVHIEGEQHVVSPDGFLLIEQAEASMKSFCCVLLQVETSSWLGGNLLVALASQASRQQERGIWLTATGVCVSKREEDEAMIQLLGGCTQWRLTWINIIASHLDHRGFFHLANVLENGRLEHLDAKREVLLRGSVPSLRKMWSSTKTSWRVGRRAAIKLTPVERPDDGWEMVEEILKGGRESARRASAAMQQAASTRW